MSVKAAMPQTNANQRIESTEELEELLALSDRVYVIYEGKIMGEVKIKSLEPDQEMIEAIGLMMTGTPLDQIHKEGVTHG